MKSLLQHSVTLLAALVGVVSCADGISPKLEKAGERAGEDVIVFTQEESTRTSLSPNAGGYDVVWDENDQITVIGAEGQSATFTIKDGVGTNRGSFSGSLSDAGSAPYCAVYPQSGTASLTEGTLTFSIPQEIGAIPAVASVVVNQDGTFAGLRNVFGLLKITLTSPEIVKIKKLTLHDLAGNMLWGTCSLQVEGGTPDYENISLEGGDNTISLVSDTYYEIGETPREFFFPVPPASLDRGFSIVLYEYDELTEGNVGRAYTFIQKISSPVAAVRSAVVEIQASAITEKSEPLEVNARGFYKSLFVCAGVYLSNYYLPEHLPFIAELGVADDYEYIATASRAQLNASATVKNDNIKGQNAVMVSSPQSGMTAYNDYNGSLIYPDGEPRFRTMFVNGGTSYTFGPTLTDKGREQIHDWYLHGGSYIGICAGTFLCTTYRDGTNRWNNADASKNYSFGIWPGNLGSTSIPVDIFDYPTGASTGAKVLEDYAKLNYATEYAAKHSRSGRAWEHLSVNDTIEDLIHQGGSYLPHSTTNSKYPHEEFIAMQWSGDASSWKGVTTETAVDSLRYTEDKVKVTKPFKTSKFAHDSTIVWAYKKDSQSGRAVLSGSHPEKRPVSSGRNFNLMTNMFLHALNGVGSPDVKGELQLNTVRKMSRTTEDNDPEYARIGDRQYHHFTLDVAEPIENFSLELSSDYDAASGVNLYLSLRKGDFAWLSDADYVICTKGGQKSLNIKRLPVGEWYIGVYCATTVTAEPYAYNEETGPFFFKYSGHTEVLDGIAYTISVESEFREGTSPVNPLPGHDLGSDTLDD